MLYTRGYSANTSDFSCDGVMGCYRGQVKCLQQRGLGLLFCTKVHSYWVTVFGADTFLLDGDWRLFRASIEHFDLALRLKQIASREFVFVLYW